MWWGGGGHTMGWGYSWAKVQGRGQGCVMGWGGVNVQGYGQHEGAEPIKGLDRTG